MSKSKYKYHKNNLQTNFTEDEIRQRAYEIWLDSKKNEDANADWYAAIKSLESDHSGIGWFQSTKKSTFNKFEYFQQTLRNLLQNHEDREFALKVLNTFITSFSLLATIIAGISIYINYKSNNDRLITDRFSKSLGQLATKNVYLRIASIYDLERISKESKEYYSNVMEILTAFVREQSKFTLSPRDQANPQQCLPAVKKNKSPSQKDKFTLPASQDIQAILTVLSRRISRFENPKLANILSLKYSNLSYVTLAPIYDREIPDPELSKYLLKNNLSANLSRFNLRGVNLTMANLTGANLTEANLQDAYLLETFLDYADLSGANLSSTYLCKAQLKYAKLLNAQLSQSRLYSADLSGANLSGADLSGADLSGADLSGADLFRAKLLKAKNLKPKQILATKNWKTAVYDKDFSKQLYSSP